jgi:hypothetical protein
MAHHDAYDDGTTELGTEFAVNDFRIKRALDAIVRSATAIEDEVVLAEDILARTHSLQHLLKEVGHRI